MRGAPTHGKLEVIGIQAAKARYDPELFYMREHGPQKRFYVAPQAR